MDAEIGNGSIVGPYAVLSPGASVASGAVTGPFYTSPDPGDGADAT